MQLKEFLPIEIRRTDTPSVRHLTDSQFQGLANVSHFPISSYASSTNCRVLPSPSAFSSSFAIP